MRGAHPTLDPDTMLSDGKYRIERVLGQGGFGITYRAEDLVPGRRVAIKEFFLAGSGRSGQMVQPPPTQADDFRSRKNRFLEEARTLARFVAALPVEGSAPRAAQTTVLVSGQAPPPPDPQATADPTSWEGVGVVPSDRPPRGGRLWLALAVIAGLTTVTVLVIVTADRIGELIVAPSETSVASSVNAG